MSLGAEAVPGELPSDAVHPFEDQCAGVRVAGLPATDGAAVISLAHRVTSSARNLPTPSCICG
ncbi:MULTISPECIES: hypothetical protein [unclassified Streptomyces]|uniref:hypothetical protein n=1 Tax=unclassified Streptomyces TaxID=2593676 RepID=UPI00369BA78A